MKPLHADDVKLIYIKIYKEKKFYYFIKYFHN